MDESWSYRPTQLFTFIDTFIELGKDIHSLESTDHSPYLLLQDQLQELKLTRILELK